MEKEQKKTGLFTTLQQMFGQSVILRDPNTRKIRVVDINDIQKYGDYESNRFVGKYQRARTSGMDFASAYNPYNAFQLMRSELYRDYECIAGSTLIPLPNGTSVSIEELAKLYPTKADKFYVFSYDPSDDSIKLGVAHSVRKTKIAQTYKITFDDDSYIIATDNHPFLMRDGSYIQVKDLEIGNSVMPFYMKDFYNDQYKFLYNFSKGWQTEHRIIAEQFYGPLKPGEVVHHKDFNKSNNLPENLQVMKDSDHKRYHCEIINKNIKWSEENKEKSAKQCRDGLLKDMKERPEYYAELHRKQSDRMKVSNPNVTHGITTENIEKRKKSLKRYHESNPGIATGQSNPNYRHNMSYELITDTAIDIYKNHGNIRKADVARELCLADTGIIDSRIKANGFNNWNQYKLHIQSTLNHKIKSIELYEIMDVYDMTVDGYHNFATENLFVHNCMDSDPILGSALDIYADESTTTGESGNILAIHTSNDKVNDALQNLFYDILNIEFNLWAWVRVMCKYGDMFLKLDIIDKVGVTNVIPLSPYAVERDENPVNPNEVYFRYDETQSIYTIGSKNRQYFHDYEIAHFRLLTDTNYLPYGRSMMEPARRVWKQLTLMEDAMLIHRIMRAPQKRVFKIDIGGIPPNEVDAYMNQIIDQMKKVPYMDEQTGQYNLKFNLQNMLEDFYLPVRGGQSGTEISDLGGMEFTGIVDIEYLKNKMFAALKIPKAYFSYEGDINSKATIAALDIRFARTIERIQKIIVSELTKIALVHLVAQGFKNSDLVDFKLELNNPSTVHEMEKLQLWGQKVDLSNNILQNKLLPKQWIYEKIFKFTDDEIDKLRSDLVVDAKHGYILTQLDGGNDPASPTSYFGGDAEAEAGLGGLESETPTTEPGTETPGETELPVEPTGGAPETETEPEVTGFGTFKESTPKKRKIYSNEFEKDLNDRMPGGYKNNPNNRKHVRSFNGGSPLALEIKRKMNNTFNKKKTLINDSKNPNKNNLLDENQLELNLE